MTQNNPSASAKSILKILTILHFAYCMAIIVFGTFALYTTENNSIQFEASEDFFVYLVPTFAIVITYASQFLYQKNLKALKEKSTLKEKLPLYQTARIIRYAMAEAPALFSVVAFLISGNLFFLIIGTALLLYLIVLRPTKMIMKEELDLNAKQEREFSEEMR